MTAGLRRWEHCEGRTTWLLSRRQVTLLCCLPAQMQHSMSEQDTLFYKLLTVLIYFGRSFCLLFLCLLFSFSFPFNMFLCCINVFCTFVSFFFVSFVLCLFVFVRWSFFSLFNINVANNSLINILPSHFLTLQQKSFTSGTRSAAVWEAFLMPPEVQIWQTVFTGIRRWEVTSTRCPMALLMRGRLSTYKMKSKHIMCKPLDELAFHKNCSSSLRCL